MNLEKRKRPKPRPKPRPDPPPPPRPTGPTRAWLYIPYDDLGKFDASVLGATDLLTFVPNSLTWEGTETQIRAEASRMLAAAGPLPLHVFTWAWGPNYKAQNPWAATEDVWQGLLSRLRAWKSTGIKGLCLDCEDEGRVAKRVPSTPPRRPDPGQILQPWWPQEAVLQARAREFVAALSGVEIGLYNIVFSAQNAYGFNGTLTPPTLPAEGFFSFCRTLPAGGWRLFLGDTYSADNAASITGQQARWLGAGALQVGAPKVVAGTWIDATRLADTPRRLGLAKHARALGVDYWLYCDPGVLLKPEVRGWVQGALR